jgi:hypothetical protein
MKKIIFAFLVLALSATSSFGAASTASDYTKTGLTIYGAKTGTAAATDTLIGRLSTGVNNYALITQHKSGVRKYGTAFDSTVINWATATKDTNVAVPSAGSVSAISGAGWTVM